MRISILLPVLLIAAGAVFGGDGGFGRKESPVFEKPDSGSKVIGTVQSGELETLPGSVTGYTVRHPLAVSNTYRKLPGGGYASSELVFESDGETGERAIVRDAPASLLRPAFSALCGILLILLVMDWFRKRKADPPLSGGVESWRCVAAIVLVRWLLLSDVLTEWDNTIAAAADENGYFQAIFDMMRGSFAGPWSFTVGTGLLYWPFILATGAVNYYGIAVPFSYFSAFVLAPGAIALGFAILRRLGFSPLRAAVPMLCWAVWPFVHFHAELWNRDFFQSYFQLFGVSGNWWNFYSVIINAGFNAMSDTPGLCAVLGCIAFALYMPLRKSSVLPLGMLFGFACLLRINNVFLAPVLAYIAFFRFGAELRSVKFACSVAGLAAAGFLVVFGFQFWVNFHQFGNPLTFGYVLHYREAAEGLRPANGFTLQTFLSGRNIRFLVGTNRAAWALGLTGLLLLRDRRLRTLLALWAIPFIWFFFGYSHTFCDARRFVFAAFPAMLAALAALECWGTLSRREAAATALLITGTLFLTLPFGADLPFLPQRELLGAISYVVPAALVALGFYFWRTGRKQPALLCAIFPVLFLIMHAYLFAAFFMLLLLRALFDWGREAFLLCGGMPGGGRQARRRE